MVYSNLIGQLNVSHFCQSVRIRNWDFNNTRESKKNRPAVVCGFTASVYAANSKVLELNMRKHTVLQMNDMLQHTELLYVYMRQTTYSE